MTEERSIGYEEGYQAGWNAAMDAKPEQPAREPLTEADYYNACLSYRHDFGLMPDEDRQKLVFEAKEWARAFGNTKGGAQ